MNSFNVGEEDARRLGAQHAYHSLVIPAMLGKLARMATALFAAENWWDVLLLQAGLKESAEIRIRSFGSFTSTKSEIGSDVKTIFNFSRFTNQRGIAFTSLRDRVRLEANGKTVYTRAIDLPAFLAEFDGKAHGNLEVRGKSVVDVGAYVCETALYYVIEGGARHVYSYEPFPEICERARDNVRLNPKYSSKISVINEAVSGRKGSALIDNRTGSFTMVSAGDRSKDAKGLSRIKLTDLAQLIEKFDLPNDSVLKVDCEGGEYEIFKRASKGTIRNFRSIHIEYHYGYSDLQLILEASGYSVRVTKPYYNYRGIGQKPMIMGELFAERMH